jgi:DNA helicase II / ATP-dependent DNA helicase PcrA
VPTLPSPSLFLPGSLPSQAPGSQLPATAAILGRYAKLKINKWRNKMTWDKDLNKDTAAYKLASSESEVIRSLAGPGSGKSFALKRRIARLIHDGIEPYKILAVTFTRTAAADLKREIVSIDIEGAEQVIARTLHSHALHIIMKEEVLASTKRTPRMLIDHEISPALRDIILSSKDDISTKKELLSFYLASWATLQNDDPGFPKDSLQKEFEENIINWLIYHSGVLIGEIIPIAIDFLRNNPSSNEIGKFSHILVDEYQDLNRSEQELVKLIKGDGNLVIVGDDDQSIYGFKFAHPEGIREILNIYPNSEDIHFDVIRRCPRQVTSLASNLISNNGNRTLDLPKPYSSNPNGIIQIIQWESLDSEITGISEIIQRELMANMISAGDILILSPRRYIGYALRDNLLTRGIKVKSYFRESVISKDFVQRAYSLIQLLANPEDHVSIRFLLGFGSSDYRKNQYSILKEKAFSSGKTVREELNELLVSQKSLKGISTILQEYRKILSDLKELEDFLKKDPELLFQSYFSKNEEQEAEFYELNEIYKDILVKIGTDSLDDHETFKNWISNVAKQLTESIALPDSPEEIDHVRIMSLHASKGLSAKFVILTTMIEQFMPYIPDKIHPNEHKKTIEEARRLFYVAMTRCKATQNGYEGRLIISSCRKIYGMHAARMGISTNPKTDTKVHASRFIKDLGVIAPKPIKGENLIKN